MKPIYLDNAASTMVAPEVVAAITEALTQTYGNPSSRHDLGLAAHRRLRQARKSIARQLGVPPEQLLFTSGGTEALGLALLGSARWHTAPGHILVSAIEHAAVQRSADLAARLGHTVERIQVTGSGLIEPDEVGRRLRPDTFLVATMHVNNEIGTVQPIAEIARVVKRRQPDCRVLVDAVQSFGVLDTDLRRLGADMVAVSAHKLHGPKGVGALAIGANIQLAPLWGGGPQEHGMRAGTENVPGILGFEAASRLGRGDVGLLAAARDRLSRAVIEAIPDAQPLGSEAARAPHIVAIALPDRSSDVAVNALAKQGICVSSGSACQSRRTKPSHVLEAIGLPPSHGVIRISPSRLLDPTELESAAARLTQTLSELPALGCGR